MGISREAQDDYGIESYQRTEAAIRSGVFDQEIVGVEVGGKTKKMVTGDEEVGRCDYHTFRQTRTYWGETVGVGSSSKVTHECSGLDKIKSISQLADGAAASLMCNQRGLEMLGVKPLARIVDWDDSALPPTQWPVAPAKGAKQMLDRSADP